MEYCEAQLGRVFILRLHDGDRLPDVLESFAADRKISSAVCFLLGGAKDKGRVVVGPENSQTIPPTPMVKLLNGVHEMCGLGTIFQDEKGKPKLHMHSSFGRDDSSITGCIRMGIDIWQIGEIVVIEMNDVIARRKRDAMTGFELLET